MRKKRKKRVLGFQRWLCSRQALLWGGVQMERERGEEREKATKQVTAKDEGQR